jgi:N-acyl-D-aspartate/D-glutamate deacylase
MTVLDLLIRGGRVIDGSGAPAFAADVGIVGDRITAVGRVDESENVRTTMTPPGPHGPAPRLRRRGLLRAGMHADVTCIDPETIRDTATYDAPRSLPEGIPYVLVNGRIVVDEGGHTGELAGRALCR